MTAGSTRKLDWAGCSSERLRISGAAANAAGVSSLDTIVALSSGRAPAAIAVVRTSGPAAFAAASAIAGDLPEPRRATLRRLIDPRDGSLIDEALVLRFDGPVSATGENIVEYQCHGGRATIDALIADIACPARGPVGRARRIYPARPGQWQDRSDRGRRACRPTHGRNRASAAFGHDAGGGRP